MVNRIRSERRCLRQMEVEDAGALLQGKGAPERPWMAGYPMLGTLIAVEADTTHANLPSQRVMERAGMRLYNTSDQLCFYRVP
jgi:hypothetical protein